MLKTLIQVFRVKSFLPKWFSFQFSLSLKDTVVNPVLEPEIQFLPYVPMSNIYFAGGTVTSQSLHDSASLYLQPLSGPPGVSSGLLSCCLTSALAPGQPVLHTMITFIFVKRESSKLVSPQVFYWFPLAT